MKYSDVICGWLRELGYTHCFFVAGGNIMHLLESCSRSFVCVPVVHEVAAGIAVEYFNEASQGRRAFALVTAGPGLTNILTAIAGAYLESRELLVIGGQVKVSDLARGSVRQKGIQEIDGVALAGPVSVKTTVVEQPWCKDDFVSTVEAGSVGRKGPVFVELPLDVQGRDVDLATLETLAPSRRESAFKTITGATIDDVAARLNGAKRPAILLGGGLSRDVCRQLLPLLVATRIPLLATWNAIDRVPEDCDTFVGRPNTWGQRSANIIVQQSDFLLALGTRLGLQQTGFNWQEFVPVGQIAQVDCDERELNKGHPEVELPICGDANSFLERLLTRKIEGPADWLGFCRLVRGLIPLNDPANVTGLGFISPYEFCLHLSQLCGPTDVVIPCSSGGANTVMMQTFAVKDGQIVFNDKGLASMGYGLSGAIGAALAKPNSRVVLVEGDGGFLQNIQELGTVMANNLNIKIFIFDDGGYASIRMTQRNYFKGNYIGCDRKTGLGIPNWGHLFAAYGIPVMKVGPGFVGEDEFEHEFNRPGASAFMVRIDPNQTYFPKISSRVTTSGGMVSNPLHLMTPPLDSELSRKVFKYLAIDHEEITRPV